MKPLFQKFNFSINRKKTYEKNSTGWTIIRPKSQRSGVTTLHFEDVVPRRRYSAHRPRRNRGLPATSNTRPFPSNASLLDRFLVDPKVPPTTNIGHVSNFNRNIHIHTIGPIGTSSHWHVINVFSHHVAFGLFRGGMTWQWYAIRIARVLCETRQSIRWRRNVPSLTTSPHSNCLGVELRCNDATPKPFARFSHHWFQLFRGGMTLHWRALWGKIATHTQRATFGLSQSERHRNGM